MIKIKLNIWEIINVSLLLNMQDNVQNYIRYIITKKDFLFLYTILDCIKLCTVLDKKKNQSLKFEKLNKKIRQ